MHYSGLQVLAWLLLLVGTGTLIASIGTDYWSTHDIGGYDVVTMHRGLWRQCTKTTRVLDSSFSTCNNRFSRFFDEIEAQLEEQRQPPQRGFNLEGNTVTLTDENYKLFELGLIGLMLVSVLLGIMSLLCGPCCCNHCNCCLTFWVLCAGMASSAAVALYAYFTYTGKTFTVRFFDAEFSLDNQQNILSWSFYLAAMGAVCQLLSAVFFACSRARRLSYSNTV